MGKITILSNSKTAMRSHSMLLWEVCFIVLILGGSNSVKAQGASNWQNYFDFYLLQDQTQFSELFLGKVDSIWEAVVCFHNPDEARGYDYTFIWNPERVTLKDERPDDVQRVEFNSPPQSIRFKKNLSIHVIIRNSTFPVESDTIEILPQKNSQASQKIILKPKRYMLDISPDTLDFEIRSGVEPEQKQIKIDINGFVQKLSVLDTTVKVLITYTCEPLNLMLNDKPFQSDTVVIFSPKNRTAILETYFLADVLSHREGQKSLKLAFSLYDQPGAQLEPPNTEIKIIWHTRGWSHFFQSPLTIVAIFIFVIISIVLVFLHKHRQRSDHFKDGAASKQSGSNKSGTMPVYRNPKDKYGAFDPAGTPQSPQKIAPINANKQRPATSKVPPSGWSVSNYAGNEETHAGNNESSAFASRADNEASAQQEPEILRNENDGLKHENREPKQKKQESPAQPSGAPGQFTNENLKETQIIPTPNRQERHAAGTSSDLGTTPADSSPANNKSSAALELDIKLQNTIHALEQIKRNPPTQDGGIKIIAVQVIQQCRKLSAELDSQTGTSPDKREKTFDDLVRGEILTILHALDEPQNPELPLALKAVIDACGITSLPVRKNESFDARKHQILDYADGPRDRIIEVYKRGFAYKNKVLNQPEVIIGRGC